MNPFSLIKDGRLSGTHWLRSLKHQGLWCRIRLGYSLLKPSDAEEHLVGLSDDVGVGFIPDHGNQPSSSTVDRATDSTCQDETGVSKVIRADQKRFFFDLGNNNRGHFLKISEVLDELELVSKTLQVERKLFYLDLKENPRGKYLKISEKTSGSRSIIIVPSSGISWFLDLFNYYVRRAREQRVAA
uniref:Transcription factor Pur-alpha 1 n=1 Tax=Brassica oleracea var. oleracea TaxID=109376 RepID=A0A0D3DN04_BRAOL